MFRQLIRVVPSVLILLVSNNALSESRLERAINKAERTTKEIDAKLKHNHNALKSLELKAEDFTYKPTKKQQPFVNKPLKCVVRHFSWGRKQPGVEYKDCLFRLNIANASEVDSLYAAITQLKTQGWDVEKSEVITQKRLSNQKIINTEQYRFMKVNQ